LMGKSIPKAGFRELPYGERQCRGVEEGHPGAVYRRTVNPSV